MLHVPYIAYILQTISHTHMHTRQTLHNCTLIPVLDDAKVLELLELPNLHGNDTDKVVVEVQLHQILLQDFGVNLREHVAAHVS